MKEIPTPGRGYPGNHETGHVRQHPRLHDYSGWILSDPCVLDSSWTYLEIFLTQDNRTGFNRFVQTCGLTLSPPEGQSPS